MGLPLTTTAAVGEELGFLLPFRFQQYLNEHWE